MIRWLCVCAVLCSFSIAGADPDPFANRTGEPSPRPEIVTPCPPPVVVVQPTLHSRSNIKIWAITGVALWAASLVVNVYAAHDYNQLRPLDRPDDLDRANRDLELARYPGTALFVGGAVALGVAGYRYFKGDDTETNTHAMVTPSVSPDHVGVAFSGGF